MVDNRTGSGRRVSSKESLPALALAEASAPLDTWSRVAGTKSYCCRQQLNTSVSTIGRGSLSGWTTCPLCDGCSKKKYVIGRGLANHLHDVHTPWKPSKMAQKIHRRQQTTYLRRPHKRQRREREKESCGKCLNSSQTDDPLIESLKIWEPSMEEVNQWNDTILKILSDVEQLHQPVMLRSSQHPSIALENIGDNKAKPAANHVSELNFMQASSSYRDSLPPFINAAANGDLITLKMMAKTARQQKSNHDSLSLCELLNTKDRHKSTAEHWAAGGGHLDCLRFLCELRANVAASSDEGTNQNTEKKNRKVRRRDGKSYLHYAARNGHLNCIRYLLEEEQKIAVDERSGDGTTPLHLACYGGQYEAAKHLIEQWGANPHCKNDWGCSCAHWMAMTISKLDENVQDLCNFLLHHQGVSFVEVQGQGHTPLHKAAHRGNRSIILWMAKSKEEDGAGLSDTDKRKAGVPDQGGHKPSDIWSSMFGESDFFVWMRDTMGW